MDTKEMEVLIECKKNTYIEIKRHSMINQLRDNTIGYFDGKGDNFTRWMMADFNINSEDKKEKDWIH